ncbi:MAG: PH domain-containing protein [Caldilinea sp.]|nr:PH domain-containing protein [Caldilinea sp.]
MIFAAKPAPERWEGVAALLWLVLIDLLAIVWALRRPIDWLQFLLFLGVVASVPVLIVLFYRTWAAFTLEYWIDRNAITLRWAHLQQVIPTQGVQAVELAGAALETEKREVLHRWPLPFLALADQTAPDAVNLCATQTPSECLVLRTTTGVYALSPVDPEGFVAALQSRYPLGATQIVEAQRVQRNWLTRLLAEDRQGAWLLLLGLAGVLLLFAVLTIRFPDLPDVLAVRYNSRGLPEEIRSKSALFRLLAIGLLAWIVNAAGGLWLARQGQRIGAHMLWGGAIVVQLFLLLALVNLIT